MRKLKLKVQLSVDSSLQGPIVKWIGWFGTGMTNSKIYVFELTDSIGTIILAALFHIGLI